MKYVLNFLLYSVLFFVGSMRLIMATTIDDVYYLSKPVEMIVSVHKDALIYFPNPVKVKDDFLNFADVIATNDVVVIRAIRAFESKRFIFQDLKTDKVYLFNLSANNGSNPRHIRLLIPLEDVNQDEIDVSNGSAYVQLTQHASMSSYYPERLSPINKNIRSVKVKSGNADYLLSFNGSAEPVKSWKGFGYFITAVRVTNFEAEKINLDPRIHYRGKWLFVTPQHGWLSPVSEKQNRVTTIYLVSERPFWEALL